MPTPLTGFSIDDKFVFRDIKGAFQKVGTVVVFERGPDLEPLIISAEGLPEKAKAFAVTRPGDAFVMQRALRQLKKTGTKLNS